MQHTKNYFNLMSEITTPVNLGKNQCISKTHNAILSDEQKAHGVNYYDDILKSESVKRGNTCLSLLAMQKMITRFLMRNLMSKDILARNLGISVDELNQVFSSEVSSELLSRINLPLIRLYCETRWL